VIDEGGAAGVIKADDSLDEHAYDTIFGGDWLCDQGAVEASEHICNGKVQNPSVVC
jgi:succinate dehydrogenase/fumarate reductase flavoprotein subunit